MPSAFHTEVTWPLKDFKKVLGAQRREGGGGLGGRGDKGGGGGREVEEMGWGGGGEWDKIVVWSSQTTQKDCIKTCHLSVQFQVARTI